MSEDMPMMNVVKFSACKGNDYKHGPFLIDEEAGTARCEGCEKVFSPIYVLGLLAREESFAGFRYRETLKKKNELDEALKTQNRCKCEHCGKLTRIKK